MITTTWAIVPMPSGVVGGTGVHAPAAGHAAAASPANLQGRFTGAFYDRDLRSGGARQPAACEPTETWQTRSGGSRSGK
jgi:hypothetical protein